MARRDFSKCPRCGSPTGPTSSITGTESEFWLECTRCNTFINTYIPQEHQAAVHRDPHRFVGNFGGYGTGKTTTSREELIKHVLITPDANALIGANVAAQYEQTIKRELEADLPSAFVQSYNQQKQFFTLRNGARIMYRPFDDPEKLRSLNLSMFVIIEGSEVKASTFTQLKTRLRNIASTTPKLQPDGTPVYKTTKEGVDIPVIEHDWRKGLIESNPSSGWIRDELLLVSSDIQKHGSVIDTYTVLGNKMDKNISSHIASSDVNAYLPPGWMEATCKNRPMWWTKRYIYGSFNYAEGLVYPTAMDHVVDDFDIPKDWKRIVAFDYGLNDDAVYVWGAVDPNKGILYIYKEQRNTQQNVEFLANVFHKEAVNVPVGGWICQPIIDPKSGIKRDYNKKTLIDHFIDYNIYFKPGQVSVDARVYRVNTYLEQGRLKIFRSCTALVKELRDYKFRPKSLDKPNANTDKPVDKDNHGINAMEWICMELPADPKKLVFGVYNSQGEDITKEARNVELSPFDDEEERDYF